MAIAARSASAMMAVMTSAVLMGSASQPGSTRVDFATCDPAFRFLGGSYRPPALRNYVEDKGIEPLTLGLQSRCSPAELIPRGVGLT